MPGCSGAPVQVQPVRRTLTTAGRGDEVSKTWNNSAAAGAGGSAAPAPRASRRLLPRWCWVRISFLATGGDDGEDMEDAITARRQAAEVRGRGAGGRRAPAGAAASHGGSPRGGIPACAGRRPSTGSPNRRPPAINTLLLCKSDGLGSRRGPRRAGWGDDDGDSGCWVLLRGRMVKIH